MNELEKEITSSVADLPRCLWGERDPNLPEQTLFSQETKHILLIKAQGGFNNGDLLAFLKRILEVEAPPEERVGLIFLINDNESDKNRDELVEEHQLLMRYLSLVQSGELETLSTQPLPEGYLAVGKQVAERISQGSMELRFDVLHNCPKKHFGKLHRHLIRLAQSLHNIQASEHEIVCHFMDLDTVFSPYHLVKLTEFYSNQENQANVSSWDLLPGLAEDGNEVLSKEMLSSVDSFRLLWYVLQASGLLVSTYRAEASATSARLSILGSTKIQSLLNATQIGEDYELGTTLFNEYDSRLGCCGEIYNVDHSRVLKKDGVFSNTEIRYEAMRDSRARTVVGFHRFFDWCKNTGQLQPPRRLENLCTVAKRLSHDRKTSFTTFSEDEAKLIFDAFVKDLDEDSSYYVGSFAKSTQLKIAQKLYNYFVDLQKMDHDAQLSDEDLMSDVYSKIWTFLSSIDVRKIALGESTFFVIPEQFNQYLEHTFAAIKKYGRAGEESMSSFSIDDPDFQALFSNERARESAKVKLRVNRLKQALTVALSDRNPDYISDYVSAIINPYLQYFQTEISQAVRKARLSQFGAKISSIFNAKSTNVGLSGSVMQIICEQFPDFFDPNSQIHVDIAKSRALFAYLRAHNVSMFN